MSLSSDGAPMLTMPVAPTNSSGNGGFGWDGNGSWFIIILFLFAFLGWGNNGWGNNGGNSGGVVDGYVLSSDFANIERKMDRWLLCREHHAAERLCRCQPKHEQRFPDR